jgi:curved DNA-binding protein CbpA
MITPYEILEVAEDAGDSQVKKAYLGMVRRYPPERFPEDFQCIYRAYEFIKTEDDRLAYRLFHCVLPAPAEIAAVLLKSVAKKDPPSREDFEKQLGADLRDFCAGLIL